MGRSLAIDFKDLVHEEGMPQVNASRIFLPSIRIWLILFVAFLCNGMHCLLSPLPCQAQEFASREDDFLRDLFDKRLYDVLQWRCQERLDSSQTPLGRKSELSAMLIRVQTIQMVDMPLSEISDRVTKVQKQSDRLTQQTQSYPRSILVKLQHALVGVEYARVLSFSALQNQKDVELKKKSQSILAQAKSQLDRLSTQLVDLKTTAPEKYDINKLYGKLTKDQITALENVVAFHRLRALECSLWLFPESDRASRKSIATELLEKATELRSSVASSSKTWWDACHAIFLAHLHLQDWENFDQAWEKLPIDQAPVAAFGDFAAIRIERFLKTKNLQRAQLEFDQILEKIDRLFPLGSQVRSDWYELLECSPWPALDLVRCRLVLELSLSQKKASAVVHEQVLKFGGKVGTRHGRFWLTRLTSDLILNGKEHGDLIPILVIRQAIGFQDMDAVQRLAAEELKKAVEGKRAEAALEIGTLVANAARKFPPQKWMMTVISHSAVSFPKQPDSGPVHSYACIIAENLLLKKEISFDEFLTVCKRQLVHWPNKSVTDSIRVPLGGRLVRNGRYIDAIDVLTGVPHNSRYLQRAAEFSEIAWDRLANQVPSDEEKLKEWKKQADRIAGGWKKMLQTRDQSWIRRWSMGSKRFALLAIDASLMSGNRVQDWTSDLLDRVIKRQPDPDLSLESRIRVVEIYLEFRKNRGTFSHQVIIDEDIESKDLVYLINRLLKYVPPIGLKGMQQKDSEKAQKQMACKLITECTEVLPEKFQSSAWFLGLRCRCNIEAGNVKNAQRDAAILVKKSPNSLYARQLEALSFSLSNDPEDAKKARNAWRWITRRTKASTDPWYEAKYYIAKSLISLGERDKAKNVLGYLKLTDKKNWNASPYRRELENLLARLGGK